MNVARSDYLKLAQLYFSPRILLLLLLLAAVKTIDSSRSLRLCFQKICVKDLLQKNIIYNQLQINYTAKKQKDMFARKHSNSRFTDLSAVL